MTASVSSLAPVVLRAARRLVVGRLCVAAAAGVLAVGVGLVELTWLTRLLAAVGVVQLVQAVYAWAGRVSLEPDGLRSRGLVFPRRVPWSQLWDCEVRATGFGRHVRVRLRGRKRYIRLPVPSSPYLFADPAFDDHVAAVRAWCAANPASEATAVRRTGSGSPRLYAMLMVAVLAAALVLDRPWDWSIGSDGALAAGLPDLCKAAPAAVYDIVGGQPGVNQSYPGRGEAGYQCVWGIDDDRQQMMFVAIDVFHRLGPYGATWRAHDAFYRFDRNFHGSVRRDLPAPIGDESVGVDALSHNFIVARRANILIQIYSHGPTADVLADAAIIAKDVADNIDLQPPG